MILESKRVPDRYFGPTSVSDNVFNKIERLLIMAILVHENRRDIVGALDSELANDGSRRLAQANLKQDLETLHRTFRWGSMIFEAAINDLETELKVNPESDESARKKRNRHSIFALALMLSCYDKEFGALPDPMARRLFFILNGLVSNGEEEALCAKAREWIKKYGLDDTNLRLSSRAFGRSSGCFTARIN
jgi:hypothetical protein